ncbi:MAG: galactokinase [Lachnospiraceae bacterium]|nr:galactokinase [Lachnospiraceae bacterium]
MTNAKQLLTQIEHHEFDSVLGAIYGADSHTLALQRRRYCDAVTSYLELFGDGGIEIYSAPGRTEVCGNHTDHQRGLILAASINLDAIAVVGTASEDAIDFVSEGYPAIHLEKSSFTEADISEEAFGTTAALIKGVLCSLRARGYRTGGFRAYVTSDVLSGSGLSSSAALESIIGTIQSGLYNDMTIPPVEIAIVGQYAENHFFGKPCGLMDQLACSVGGFVYVDFHEPEHPLVDNIPFDLQAAGYTLCIVDTRGSHANLTDDYASIPVEMGQVAACFEKDYLSEITLEAFLAAMPDLYGKVSDRALLRAYHFLTENERVKTAANALMERRFDDFLACIQASGSSSYRFLQNVYSNKYEQQQPVPVTLMLTEQYLAANGVCRVHGGGFAGTIQVFVKNECVTGYKEFIEQIVGDGTCHVLRIRKQGGIKVL